MRLEVNNKTVVFWNVMLYSVVVSCQPFRQTCLLHFQGVECTLKMQLVRVCSPESVSSTCQKAVCITQITTIWLKLSMSENILQKRTLFECERYEISWSLLKPVFVACLKECLY